MAIEVTMKHHIIVVIALLFGTMFSVSLAATSAAPKARIMKKAKGEAKQEKGISLVQYAEKHPLEVYTVKRTNDPTGLPLEDIDPRNNLLAGYKVLAMSRKGLTDINGISELMVLDGKHRKKISDVENLLLLFGGNQISDIPVELSKLNNVVLLFFKGNRIKTVPKELAKMKSLERIYFTRNEISEIPEEIFELKLTKFDVGDNRLKEISPRLCEKVRLAHLNLSGNQLKTLPDCMGNMQHLKVLDLADNLLTSLPKSLAKVSIVHTLRLDGNKDLTTIPDGEGFANMTANITIEGTAIDVKKLSKALQARIKAKDLRD